jgi:hypothetical protein
LFAATTPDPADQKGRLCRDPDRLARRRIDERRRANKDAAALKVKFLPPTCTTAALQGHERHLLAARVDRIALPRRQRHDPKAEILPARTCRRHDDSFTLCGGRADQMVHEWFPLILLCFVVTNQPLSADDADFADAPPFICEICVICG